MAQIGGWPLIMFNCVGSTQPVLLMVHVSTGFFAFRSFLICLAFIIVLLVLSVVMVNKDGNAREKDGGGDEMAAGEDGRDDKGELFSPSTECSPKLRIWNGIEPEFAVARGVQWGRGKRGGGMSRFRFGACTDWFDALRLDDGIHDINEASSVAAFAVLK